MKYVAGFMFNATKDAVALIRKSKPSWQKGLLNGVGGKIEDGETPEFAMMREFCEETGATTHPGEWRHYARLTGTDWCVELFTATGDIAALKSMEEEPIQLVLVKGITITRGDMVENLPWLIAAALDHMADGRPSFWEVSYP